MRSTSAPDARRQQPLPILDRLEAHAPGGGLHDDGVMGAESGSLKSAMCSTPCDGQRARLLKGERWWLRRKQERDRTRYARQRCVTDSKHSVANHVRTRGVDLGYRARSIATRRARVARVFTKYIKNVTEVKADCAHAQQHFIGFRGAKRRLSLEKEVTDCPTRVEVQSNWPTYQWRDGYEARCTA